MLPFVNTAAMNAHLAEIARTVAPGAHAVLVLDGAGWHGGARSSCRITSPSSRCRPTARNSTRSRTSGSILRANWLAISVFDDYDAIVDACCKAWNRFADQPDIVSSITSRQWAEVNP